MTLYVARLHARFGSAEALPPARVRGWLSAFAGQDDEALASAAGASAAERGDAAWLLVRRLPMRLRWRVDAADAEVAPLCGQALEQALRAALEEGTGDNVLRYARREDAWADLLYRSALGQTDRQWAWQRQGLLDRAGQPPAQALQQGWQRLVDDAAAIWPVLHRLMAAEADCAALSAVLHAVAAADWQRLLAASLRTAPYLNTQEDRGHGRLPVAPPLPAAMVTHIAWARSRPVLLAQRPQAVLALLAAQAWPGPPPSLAEGARRVGTVRTWVGDGPDTAGLTRVAAAPAPAAACAATPADADTLPGPPRAVAPADPEPDEPLRERRLPALPQPEPDTVATAWAGALFWLPRVPASGLLALPGAPLPVVPAALLLALARALGVPDDDPVSTVFCGGPQPEGPVAEALSERAQAQAQQWADWLDAQAQELPAPRLAHVCRRPGRLRVLPGWVELRLPLDAVEVPLRRLGLDLNPGWLPWWGSVLHIRYDD
jgi:hypothetical protein